MQPSRFACRLLSLAAVLMLAATLAAEDTKPPQTPTKPGPKMLYEYLRSEAQKHFDARRKTISELKTPEDLRKRQKELRQRFIDSLGGFPKKTPLKARVVGKIKADGYTVEKVIYESRPNHHVTANFYLPKGDPPFPGVLLPCGHSANGKAAGAYQRASILLAKHGFAVLCYDPIGQGERIQLLNDQGKPAIRGSTSEHTMVGVGALLVGRNTATYRIWDGIRSLDYLAGRPEVDPKRLGCTGNSGGGTMTSYLMALDERIACAAPSCYVTSLERLFATIGPQDAEQNITGQVAFGMEHADYVTMRAPKPTLILTGTQDFFDIQGSWTTFREAKLLYGLLGHGERVSLFEYNDKHGFSKPRRVAALRWMRRWLMHKDDAPTEGDFPIHKDEELQCTRTGQVLEDLKGKSAFDLNAERERELAKQRAKFLKENDRAAVLKKVRELLALPEVKPPVKSTVVETTRRAGVRKVMYETEPGVLVPATFFNPPGERNGDSILYLDGEGTEAAEARIAQLVKQGHTVLALDVRGTGASSPRKASRTLADQGADWKEAFLALHISRPLLGQRVYDVLSVLKGVESSQAKGISFKPDSVHIMGVGRAAPIALHAAALDERIKQVTLERPVLSWSAVVHTPISKNQLANVVPGVLAYYDLPDLAARIAPRPLTIRNVLDAAGKPVSRQTLEAAYSVCKKAYESHKAGDRLKLEND